MRIVELTESTRKNVLNDLLKRSPNNYSEYEDVYGGRAVLFHIWPECAGGY